MSGPRALLREPLLTFCDLIQCRRLESELRNISHLAFLGTQATRRAAWLWTWLVSKQARVDRMNSEA